jgi:hypothetical protein
MKGKDLEGLNKGRTANKQIAGSAMKTPRKKMATCLSGIRLRQLSGSPRFNWFLARAFMANHPAPERDS